MIDPEVLANIDAAIIEFLTDEAKDAEHLTFEVEQRIAVNEAMRGRFDFNPDKREAIINEYVGGRLKIYMVVEVNGKHYEPVAGEGLRPLFPAVTA
jgi:hypothetical protein